MTRATNTSPISPGQPPVHRSEWFRGRSPSMLSCVVSLCLVGVAVIAMDHWLGLLRAVESGAWGRRTDWELQLLQPLIGGSLVILLLWVWLDHWLKSSNVVFTETRCQFCLAAIGITCVSRAVSLGFAGVLAQKEIAPLATFLVLPTVAPVTVLLWFAAGRLASLRLRTALLLGFAVLNVVLLKVGPQDTSGDTGAAYFFGSSCLIGLAVLTWLIVLAATPHSPPSHE